VKKLLVLLPIAALVPLLMTFLAGAEPIPGGHYTGTVDGGGTVQFDVSADGAQVLNFAASNVPGTIPPPGSGPCSFATRTVTIPLDITADAFGPGIPNYFEVAGTFPGEQAAEGTLRLVLEPIPPYLAGCDSGPLNWVATGEVLATATATATATASPGTGGSASPTPSPTLTATATATPTATATATAIPEPTDSPTPTATPVETPTPTPTPSATPTTAATPEFTLTPKADTIAATATPTAPPPTGSGGDGGIGGLGLALALLLAAALLAGTASLIAFSFRQQE
jgi:hypothetical protein